MSLLQRVAMTPGEPAGIGPDLCVRLAQQDHACELVCVADAGLLKARASLLGLPLEVEEARVEQSPRPSRAGRIRVLAEPLGAPCVCGQLEPGNAEYVLRTLRRAVQGCLDGRFAALVTGPVHKGVINEAGFPFSGHTEYLAKLTGGDPVMMLAVPGLRVALATTHLPLSRVSGAITRPTLTRTLEVLHADLRQRFAIPEPRILVCGLNPHAGEGGHLGREEIEVIAPVVAALRSRGMRLDGPVPADTAFVPAHLRDCDAVLAMYHDQGLPVIKHLGFGRAVNITLGLPIIRTSVDHGTALELAGTGRIRDTSLRAALDSALTLAAHAAAPQAP